MPWPEAAGRDGAGELPARGASRPHPRGPRWLVGAGHDHVAFTRLRHRPGALPRRGSAPPRSPAARCCTPSTPTLELVRAACDRAGLELSVLGAASWQGGFGVDHFSDVIEVRDDGTVIDHQPDRASFHVERQLADADVVFGLGRSAVEALAMGRACVVFGYDDVGDGLVTPDRPRSSPPRTSARGRAAPLRRRLARPELPATTRRTARSTARSASSVTRSSASWTASSRCWAARDSARAGASAGPCGARGSAAWREVAAVRARRRSARAPSRRAGSRSRSSARRGRGRCARTAGHGRPAIGRVEHAQVVDPQPRPPASRPRAEGPRPRTRARGGSSNPCARVERNRHALRFCAPRCRR